MSAAGGKRETKSDTDTNLLASNAFLTFFDKRAAFVRLCVSCSVLETQQRQANQKREEAEGEKAIKKVAAVRRIRGGGWTFLLRKALCQQSTTHRRAAARCGSKGEKTNPFFFIYIKLSTTLISSHSLCTTESLKGTSYTSFHQWIEFIL